MRKLRNLISVIISSTIMFCSLIVSLRAQDHIIDNVDNLIKNEKVLLRKFINGYKRELLKVMKTKIIKNPTAKKTIKKEYREKYLKTKTGLTQLFSAGKLELSRTHTQPSMSLTSPSGYGSNWGSITLFVLGYNKKANANRPDGDAGIAVGLGNSKKYLGVSLAFANTNLVDTKKENGKVVNDYSKPAFDEGVLSIKIHRQITANSSIAIGRSPLWAYGYPDDLGSSIVSNYFSGSYRLFRGPQQSPFSILQFTLGAGSKGFNSTKNFAAGKSGFTPFAGFSTRLSKSISFITDYSREELTIGGSYAPFESIPLVTSLGIRNVLKKDNFNRRFLLSMSYSFYF